MSKKFVDFSFDEMCSEIVNREPSITDLHKKSLILLRGALVCLGRLDIVFLATTSERSIEFSQHSIQCMEKLAQITAWLSDYDFLGEKTFEEIKTSSDELEEVV